MALLRTHRYILVLLTSLVALAALDAPPAVLLALPALTATAILATLLRTSRAPAWRSSHEVGRVPPRVEPI